MPVASAHVSTYSLAMKSEFLLPLIALFFASCSVNTPATRIEKSPAVFNDLSQRHQEMARAGRIENGMTPDGVYIAWGKPDSKSEGEQRGQRFQRWNYMGLTPVYNQGFYSGYGYGGGYYDRRGYGHYGSPYFGQSTSVDYIPYRAAFVDFENDRVKGWQRGR